LAGDGKIATLFLQCMPETTISPSQGLRIWLQLFDLTVYTEKTAPFLRTQSAHPSLSFQHSSEDWSCMPLVSIFCKRSYSLTVGLDVVRDTVQKYRIAL
jgi:hypothetical protein